MVRIHARSDGLSSRSSAVWLVSNCACLCRIGNVTRCFASLANRQRKDSVQAWLHQDSRLRLAYQMCSSRRRCRFRRSARWRRRTTTWIDRNSSGSLTSHSANAVSVSWLRAMFTRSTIYRIVIYRHAPLCDDLWQTSARHQCPYLEHAAQTSFFASSILVLVNLHLSRRRRSIMLLYLLSRIIR